MWMNNRVVMANCVGKRSRKKIRPTNQEPKIIQEDCIQGFRSWITNRCSGRRVDEAGGSRSRDASHDPSHDLPHERIPRAIPLNRSPRRRRRKKKLLEEGSKL